MHFGWIHSDRLLMHGFVAQCPNDFHLAGEWRLKSEQGWPAANQGARSPGSAVELEIDVDQIERVIICSRREMNCIVRSAAADWKDQWRKRENGE